jgi:N,N'-diacetyllegionaminate synthase
MSFDGQPGCLVIAEVAQAHDGSLGMAHAFIDAVAETGAGAIKFQTHIAAAESSLAEPWRVKFSYQDDTRYQYWQRMEFSEAQWAGLKEHAERRGLRFLSSPFSIQAVEMLHRLGMSAWKIASGEISNIQLLDAIIATRLPILLSTGMSDWAEVDRAVDRIRGANIDFTLMQCTSAYPCPPERIGLNMLPALRQRYGCKIGLSDHSGTIYAGLAAATIGIEALEVHVTLSREMFGPDVSSSVTTAELRQLVEGIRFIERAKTSPVNKDMLAQEMEPMKRLFSKSLVAGRDLAAGTMLQASDLESRKPGNGIAADQLSEIVGRKLQRPLQRGQFLAHADLEEVPMHASV